MLMFLFVCPLLLWTLSEPNEKSVLTCLLSHRTIVELDSSETKGDHLNALRPDCNQYQSSHTQSISPTCAHIYQALKTNEFLNSVPDTVLAISNENFSANDMQQQHNHFSNGDLVLIQSQGNHSCNSILPVSKSKSVQTDSHLNHSYTCTNTESIGVTGPNGTASRMATSPIASLKRYCLCSIL